MINGRQSIENPKTVALLDVDETLLSYTFSPDFLEEKDEYMNSQYVDYIYNQLIKNGDSVNMELLNALKAKNIKDIYLFTDMNLTKNDVRVRLALKNFLVAAGFTVHGVMTPGDAMLYAPNTQLKQFTEFGASRDALNKHYAEYLDTTGLGVAFANIEEDLDEDEIIDEKVLNAQYSRNYLIARAKTQGVAHLKGYMFEHFIAHNNHPDNPNRFDQIVVCDDNKNVLQSVKQIYEQSTHGGLMVDNNQYFTIYVNNVKSKKKGEAEERSRTSEDYMKILDVLKLKTALENYSQHLSAAGTVKAGEKKSVIDQMKQILSAPIIGEYELKSCGALYSKNRLLLESRRYDFSAIAILKGLATLFSLGIAAYVFDFWKVDGRKYSKDISEALPPEFTRPAMGA